jgi:uncharacterized protein (TIGR00369 family)
MPRRRQPRTSGRAKPSRTPIGLTFFKKMIAGDLPRAPMTRLLDFRLLEAEEGRVVFGAVPTRSHYNGMGVVHGGLVAALLDSALGCALNTLAPPGGIFTTVEIKINYTRPLTDEVGPLRCEARAVHVGNRVGPPKAVSSRHGRVRPRDGGAPVKAGRRSAARARVGPPRARAVFAGLELRDGSRCIRGLRRDRPRMRPRCQCSKSVAAQAPMGGIARSARSAVRGTMT